MNTPGILHTPARRFQVTDYSGLCFGKIAPTDIDGFIDWHGKACILFELKHGDAELPKGQRRALEALVKGRQGIVLVATHCINDTSQTVNAADCKVRELYLSCTGVWRKPRIDVTLGEAVKRYVEILERRSI